MLNHVRQLNPQVIVTLDRSSSMWKKYGTATLTRLQIVQQTLQSLLKTYSESIHFGYVEYPVKECRAGCCASSVIPPNPRTLPLIERRWSCEFLPATCGQTTADSPVAQALRESRWYFEDEDGSSASRHVLVLTDGEPSCAANMAQNDCSMAVVEVGKLSASYKVSTRVYGLSEELRASSCLDMMATLGSNTAPGQPTASHRITVDGEQLFQELDRWFATLAQESCSFRLSLPVNPAVQKLEVKVDGRTVPLDPTRTDGWDYDIPDAPTRVRLYGSYCDRVRVGASIDAEFTLCSPAAR